jgi:DNA-binding NarL/FixJ family response regulator
VSVSDGPRILFVDDEPLILEGLRDLLRPRRYRLSFANSGEEALERLRREGADVVVTDERMPGLQGSALCAAVAREFPRTPRLILTGHATVQGAVTAINEGRIAGFLCKPVKASELERAVEQALRTRELELALDRFVSVACQLTPPGTSEPGEMPGDQRSALPSLAVGAFAAEAMRLLSPREREVFDLLAEGYRVGQVAKMLFRSHHTVRNHLKAIFEKLDVRSQEDLVRKARLG